MALTAEELKRAVPQNMQPGTDLSWYGVNDFDSYFNKYYGPGRYATTDEVYAGYRESDPGWEPNQREGNQETYPSRYWIPNNDSAMALNGQGPYYGGDDANWLDKAIEMGIMGAFGYGAYGALGGAGSLGGAEVGALGEGMGGTFAGEGSLEGSWWGGSGGDFGGGGGGWEDFFNFSENGYQPSGSADFASSINNTTNNPFGSNMPLDQFGGINYNSFLFPGTESAAVGSSGLASSISPTSLGGSLASTAAGGGDFMSGLKDVWSKINSPLIPGTNFTGTNLASGLLNYFMQAQKQDQLNAAANKSAQLNDPMQQAGRLPFQAAYGNLMFNPNSYKSTPYAQGQNELARQAFEANVSKFGPGGTQFSDYLKNFQNIQSNDFFKLADQFQVAGGFNQGTGGAGTAYGNLAGQAANAGLSAYEGFGRLFQPAPSNSSTSTPSNFDFSSPYKPTENPFSMGYSLS